MVCFKYLQGNQILSYEELAKGVSYKKVREKTLRGGDKIITMSGTSSYLYFDGSTQNWFLENGHTVQYWPMPLEEAVKRIQYTIGV